VKKLAVVAALAGALVAPRAAHAFCGFYINGAGGEMFNNATQVVMMRKGTRTVLSMQNNYQGPPSDFAMVVPVPVVLQEGQVKTLDKEVFTKVDQMSSPRLVEYWEEDPCATYGYGRGDFAVGAVAPSAAPAMEDAAAQKDYGVTIEAKFVVGEYQIVILSAKESTGLDRYLRDEGYKIPDGAEPLLRPYVAAGSKFFVAKVDPKKVKFEAGMATLSPLRFFYDADEFTLPIRLGLANSSGTQDLIVNILSPEQRYEVTNYPNVTIPTNLDVKDAVRKRFGEFYAALFDRTIERNPRAVVTEYAWDASSCDPCPGPTLDWNDFTTLGADVLEGTPDAPQQFGGGFVLTRLHTRYGKDGAPEDLVFKKAGAIVGGREMRGPSGKLEERAQPSDYNNFQGRYIIRHEWTGAIACENPVRGRWGGPPPEVYQQMAGDTGPVAATNIAFAPRGAVELPDLVAQDVPELAVVAGKPMPKGAGFTGKPQGCGCAAGGAAAATGGAVLGLGVLALITRRRRKASR
jgi:MYXO-CTERM domain-containing protein